MPVHYTVSFPTYYPLWTEIINDWAEEVIDAAAMPITEITEEQVKSIVADWMEDDGIEYHTARAVELAALKMIRKARQSA